MRVDGKTRALNVVREMTDEQLSQFFSEIPGVTIEELALIIERILSPGLKPCPFCGRAAVIDINDQIITTDKENKNSFVERTFCARCKTLGCAGHNTNYFKSSKLAVEAWNRRVSYE